MPYLCINCLYNAEFFLEEPITCPNCNKRGTIKFFERLCASCDCGLNINDYLKANIFFNEDDIENTLTYENVDLKERLVKIWDSDSVQILCCDCDSIFAELKGINDPAERLDLYCKRITENFRNFNSPIDDVYLFGKKRVEIYNKILDKITIKNFLWFFKDAMECFNTNFRNTYKKMKVMKREMLKVYDKFEIYIKELERMI